MAKAKGSPAARASERYLALVKAFPLRPLGSDNELDEAIAMIDSLLDRDDLAADEEDYLDVLSDQVERYEREHHPMPAVSDADMLRHLMESRGLTQTELAAATGVVVSTISSILSGKRRINRQHIEKFATHFKVNPSVFLPRPPAPRKATRRRTG